MVHNTIQNLLKDFFGVSKKSAKKLEKVFTVEIGSLKENRILWKGYCSDIPKIYDYLNENNFDLLEETCFIFWID